MRRTIWGWLSVYSLTLALLLFGMSTMVNICSAAPILLEIRGANSDYQIQGTVALWPNLEDTYTGRVWIWPVSEGRDKPLRSDEGLWTGHQVAAYDVDSNSFSQTNAKGVYTDGYIELNWLDPNLNLAETMDWYTHTLVIPEPSAACIFLLGLLGVICISRFK